MDKKGQMEGVQGNELVVHPFRKFINFEEDKTKLNLGKMYNKALKLSEIVSNLRNKIQILEGKYDFLEFCNKEFGENNKNIMNKLQKTMDKKYTLESFFTLLINNFFPNLKLVDNTLPNSSEINNNQLQNNNQLTDKRNKEIITQLYKILNINDNNSNDNNISQNNKNSIIINNNITGNNIIPNSKKSNNILNGINIINSTNDDNNNIIYNKNKINQIMEQIADKESLSTESREIKTYNKIMNFQKEYFKDLEVQKSNNYIGINNESQNIKENNSFEDIKNDKDIFNVTSENDSLNKSKDKNIIGKKSLKDGDESISDGSKDLL